MRLCYVNSAVPIIVKKKVGGSFDLSCVNPTQLKELKHVIEIIKNVTDLVIEPEVRKCTEKMQSNSTDIAVANVNLREAGPNFKVPVPWDPTTLYIASSYNETQYQLDQANRGKSFLGILNNVYAFEGEVYLVIALLVSTLAIVSFCHQLLFRSKGRLRKGKKWKKKSRRPLSNFLSRTTVFIMAVANFLLFNPFRCMYKTTQVTVDKPPLITNYEQLMQLNSSISFSNLYVNVQSFLEPNEQNVRKKDIIYRMYHHFLTHQLNGTPRNKKEVLDHIKEARKLQFKSKLVNIGDDVYIGKALAIACKMTFKGELHRYHQFHDPNQREELTGWAFRKDFEDPKLVKKLRTVFEMGTMDVRERKLARYLFNDFKLVESTQEHYYKQNLLCFDNQVRPYELTETFTSGFSFFAIFFLIALLLFFIAFVLHLIERKLFRRVKKVKMSIIPPKQQKNVGPSRWRVRPSLH